MKEVEWKRGDWFVYVNDKDRGKYFPTKGYISQVEHVSYKIVSDGFYEFYQSDIRPATEKEILEVKSKSFKK